MILFTADVNNLESVKQTGRHYTVDEIKKTWLEAEGTDRGFYSDKSRDLYYEAMEEYELANKKYRAALAATGEEDYERQARILESASGMYATLGNTKAQEQVENAAIAARAQAAAQRLSFPAWIAVCGILGGLFLIQRKQK
jgi:hypothetical protein